MGGQIWYFKVGCQKKNTTRLVVSEYKVPKVLVSRECSKRDVFGPPCIMKRQFITLLNFKCNLLWIQFVICSCTSDFLSLSIRRSRRSKSSDAEVLYQKESFSSFNNFTESFRTSPGVYILVIGVYLGPRPKKKPSGNFGPRCEVIVGPHPDFWVWRTKSQNFQWRICCQIDTQQGVKKSVYIFNPKL